MIHSWTPPTESLVPGRVEEAREEVQRSRSDTFHDAARQGQEDKGAIKSFSGRCWRE